MIKPGQIYKNDDVVTSIYVVTNVIYGMVIFDILFLLFFVTREP